MTNPLTVEAKERRKKASDRRKIISQRANELLGLVHDKPGDPRFAPEYQRLSDAMSLLEHRADTEAAKQTQAST